MWKRNEVYLKTPSVENLTSCSWMLSAIYYAKLKITTGGQPGTKMDKKPSTDATTCSSVKYPSIKDIMETMCLVPSGNLEEEYGGLSLGISTQEGMKV